MQALTSERPTKSLASQGRPRPGARPGIRQGSLQLLDVWRYLKVSIIRSDTSRACSCDMARETRPRSRHSEPRKGDSVRCGIYALRDLNIPASLDIPHNQALYPFDRARGTNGSGAPGLRTLVESSAHCSFRALNLQRHGRPSIVVPPGRSCRCKLILLRWMSRNRAHAPWGIPSSVELADDIRRSGLSGGPHVTAQGPC